jgi:hypothetical protein
MRHEDYRGGMDLRPTNRDMAAAEGMLDERRGTLPSRPYNNNDYSFGRIGDYSMVIDGYDISC